MRGANIAGKPCSAGAREMFFKYTREYKSVNPIIRFSIIPISFDLNGYKITRQLGVVRGITVRSRSVFGTIGGSLQTILGGNITLFTQLCEKSREEAFDMMLEHAEALGANAVVGVRYDATELMNGVTEVLCYGTAVQVSRD